MSVPEGWKESSLAKMLEKLKDGTHFSPQICGGEFKYITSKNVRMGNLDLGNIQYIDEIQHKKIFRGSPVQYGDVLFTKDGANAGNVCLNTLHEEFSILSSVAILSGGKYVADNIFLLNLLMWDNTQAAIKNNVSGQAITRLTLKQIGELRFVFPPLAEQKKIAAILSTWDKAIEATDKLLENSRQQKKVLMQQLLTRKARLPGFSGEWENVRLNACYLFLSTATNPRSELVNSGDYKYIHYGDIHKSDDIHWDCNKKYLPEIYKTSLKCRTFVRSGDLIVADASEDYCGIAKSVEITNTGNISIISGLHTILMRPDLSKIALLYSGYILKSPDAKLKIQKVATGISVYSISKKELGSITVDLPPLPEQQAIARVLTTADKEIDALTQKAALLRQEKRALMQQLLTGKKRVRVEA